jgi:ligand-binding sensor domain-containing protein
MKSITTVLALGLLILTSGCGSSSGKKAASSGGGEASGTKVVAHKPFGEENSPEGSVTALCLTENGLFVGTKKGLHAVKYDAKAATFGDADIRIEDTALKKFEVTNIRKDNARVLVSTMDGLAQYDGKSWQSESIGPVNDVVAYADTLWLARGRGLDKKGGDDWREEKVPGLGLNQTSASRIHGLAVAPDGKLWIGSEFGIYSFHAAEKKWGKQLYGDYLNIQGEFVTPEKGNSELCGNIVNRIDLDGEGRLLICTQTGLSVFDGKEGWKKFQGDYETHTAETGLKSRVKRKGNIELPHPSVTTAAFLGNLLWIGTPEGLVRLDGDKSQLFDTGTNLPSSAITALAHDAANQVLFVGTDKGLVALAPVAAGAPAPAK